MSWIYFQALADLVKPPATASPSSGSTPAPSPTVSVSPSPRPCSCPGCTEARSTPPRSGTTSRHWGALEAARSRNPLTCSSGDGLVRGTALRAFAEAWRTSAPAWSAKSLGLWATFDPVACSWKTSQECLPLQGMESATSCESWPVSGMTQGGRAFQRRKPGPLTPGTDSGFWPTARAEDSESAGAHRGVPDTLTAATRAWATPQSRDYKNGVQPGHKGKAPLNVEAGKWATPKSTTSGPDYARAGRRDTHGSGADDLVTQAARLSHPAPPHPTTGTPGPKSSEPAPKLNPQFVEWLMGYPIGTTACEPWATAWIISRRGRRLKS